MTPEDRILPLEGVENFRDYGGYAVPGGRRIVRGKLWRSAHHGGATDADLAQIAGLDLAAVVDLRRPTERANQPSRRPGGFAGRVIDCDAGDQAEAPHVAFLRETDLSAESARASCASLAARHARMPRPPPLAHLTARPPHSPPSASPVAPRAAPSRNRGPGPGGHETSGG